MTAERTPQLPSEVRNLLRMRVAVAPGIGIETSRETWHLLVPRRGRVERWLAKLVHRGRDPRLRVRLDGKGQAVVRVLVDAGALPVPELAARLDVPVPRDDEGGVAPGGPLEPDSVALLVFLWPLVQSHVLTAEPI